MAHPALDLDALELNASVATGVLVRLRALVQGLRQRVIAPRYSTRYVCTSACFICNEVLYWNSKVRPAIAWVDDPAVAGHLWAV